MDAPIHQPQVIEPHIAVKAKGKTSQVLTARQLADLKFKTLPLASEWSKHLGLPADNFDMMLHGQPGHGKTVWLLKFAKDLADQFGKVLFVSKEEYGAATLTDKVNQFNIKSPNLFFSSDINGLNLSDYQFVFLDSINVLKLNIEDYKQLREQHPNTAFIIILQTTKDGKFKGGKDWEHEVEIAGEVKNRELRVYKNRYGVLSNETPLADPSKKKRN